MNSKVLRYEFGDYVLMPSERLLFCAGQSVPLKSKVFETLLTLVRHQGKLLTKDELMTQIWGNNFVEEANLTQNIFTLRKIFGENPKEHRFIVTVPGRGYRLRPGLLLALEPWIMADTAELRTDADGWTLRSATGSRTAHSEHTIAITDDGAEILTLPQRP